MYEKSQFSFMKEEEEGWRRREREGRGGVRRREGEGARGKKHY